MRIAAACRIGYREGYRIGSGRSVGMCGSLWLELPPSPKVQYQVAMVATAIPVGVKAAGLLAQALWVLKSTAGLGFIVIFFVSGIRTVVAGKGDQFYRIGSGRGIGMGWVLQDAGIAGTRGGIAKIPVPAADGLRAAYCGQIGKVTAVPTHCPMT